MSNIQQRLLPTEIHRKQIRPLGAFEWPSFASLAPTSASLAMPMHNPQRDPGLCQQHFPASLCHASTRGFASSLPGRDWMTLNLYSSPNLAEISQQAGKPSAGAAPRLCPCTRTQSTITQRLLPVETGQKREQLHPAIPALALLSVLFSAWLHLLAKWNLCSMGRGPSLGTELVSS